MSIINALVIEDLLQLSQVCRSWNFQLHFHRAIPTSQHETLEALWPELLAWNRLKQPLGRKFTLSPNPHSHHITCFQMSEGNQGYLIKLATFPRPLAVGTWNPSLLPESVKSIHYVFVRQRVPTWEHRTKHEERYGWPCLYFEYKEPVSAIGEVNFRLLSKFLDYANKTKQWEEAKLAKAAAHSLTGQYFKIQFPLMVTTQ